MNIQQISESISNIRQCSNAKPPINHDIKHAEEAEIKVLIAEFKSNGGKIIKIASFGSPTKMFTYKQRNDSTYAGASV